MSPDVATCPLESKNHTPRKTAAPQGLVKGVQDKLGTEPGPLRAGLGKSDPEGRVSELVLHSELRVPCLQGLALLRTLRAAECVLVLWARRGTAVASVAPPPPGTVTPALGSHHLRSEAVSAQVTDMRRNADRAARLSPSPDHEALRSRQKHRSLQVREKGALALQRRQDLPQQKSPQRLADELEAGWQEAPSLQVRGLERPYLAHLSGTGGGRGSDSQGPAQRGAARPQRAREKHRAAVREEKSCREELVGRQPWRTKSQRKAVGTEKQGPPRAAGRTRHPLCPHEKNKGKRVPSMKTRGGSRPAEPRGDRGVHIEEFLAAAGELERREKEGREGARDGQRQPGKGAAPPGQGPDNNRQHQSPEGKAEDLEELWPVGWTHRGGGTPQASPCQRGDKSRWQRELEFAFQELFNTNRELKKHLNLHLAAGPGVDQSSREELGLSEVQECRGEPRRDKTAVGAEADMQPGGEPTCPVQADAHQTESQTSLKEFLNKLKNQKYLRLAKFPRKTESEPLSPKARVFIGEENRLLGGTGSGQAAARPDLLVEGARRRSPRDQADGAGLAGLWQGPGGQLELWHRMGPPGLSWEAHSQAGLEEQREQRRACLARLKSFSSLDQGKEGACEHDTSLWAPSFMDDDRHSQMIRDLQQQIEEQNKLHKQFLEEARKRLQEFRRI